MMRTASPTARASPIAARPESGGGERPGSGLGNRPGSGGGNRTRDEDYLHTAEYLLLRERALHPVACQNAQDAVSDIGEDEGSVGSGLSETIDMIRPQFEHVLRNNLLPEDFIRPITFKNGFKRKAIIIIEHNFAFYKIVLRPRKKTTLELPETSRFSVAIDINRPLAFQIQKRGVMMIKQEVEWCAPIVILRYKHFNKLIDDAAFVDMYA